MGRPGELSSTAIHRQRHADRGRPQVTPMEPFGPALNAEELIGVTGSANCPSILGHKRSSEQLRIKTFHTCCRSGLSEPRGQGISAKSHLLRPHLLKTLSGIPVRHPCCVINFLRFGFLPKLAASRTQSLWVRQTPELWNAARESSIASRE